MGNYFFLFSYVLGLGYRRLQLLEKYFGSLEKAWEADSGKWMKVGVNRAIAGNFREFKKKMESGFDPREDLKNNNINYISYEDKEYPESLRNIDSPPIGLFYRGNIELLRENKKIAVVGTRRVSEYGARMTRRFVVGLVERGFVIISGMAAGVDTIAHKNALLRGGKTIGVLAHGLDLAYPESNHKLKEEIADKGLLISEYPPGIAPRREYFPARNRIVAGVSDSVLVCEAPVKSGTKITAGFAGDQGKDVYVIPGPIDLPGYKGSVEIIRDGGIPVSEVGDIE